MNLAFKNFSLLYACTECAQSMKPNGSQFPKLHPAPSGCVGTQLLLCMWDSLWSLAAWMQPQIRDLICRTLFLFHLPNAGNNVIL